MTKYELIASKLTEGQKITLCFGGGFGGISKIKTVFHSAEFKPHYRNAPIEQDGVTIMHKPKGKRSMYNSTLCYLTPVVIYNGWIEIDTDDITFDIKHENGFIIKTSKYMSMDKQLFIDLVAKYSNPILQHI